LPCEFGTHVRELDPLLLQQPLAHCALDELGAPMGSSVAAAAARGATLDATTGTAAPSADTAARRVAVRDGLRGGAGSTSRHLASWSTKSSTTVGSMAIPSPASASAIPEVLVVPSHRSQIRAATGFRQ
jgi:hypothetical protein